MVDRALWEEGTQKRVNDAVTFVRDATLRPLHLRVVLWAPKVGEAGRKRQRNISV